MPVLANALLSARDNRLAITGTDLEVELVAATKVGLSCAVVSRGRPGTSTCTTGRHIGAQPVAAGIHEWSARVGHEQRERRAVFVVSVDALLSALGLAMVCAINTHGGRATNARNDLEVPIPSGMAATGVVLPQQMRTIDIKARNATNLCAVPRAMRP